MGDFVTRKRWLIVAVTAVLFAIAGCAPAPRVGVVADSMGSIDPPSVIAQIEAGGNTVTRYYAEPGTTTWTHSQITSVLFDPAIDVIVVTFGLNEVRAIRGDPDITPQTMPVVLASWQTVADQAAANGKCLVWANMQTAAPLNTEPTVGIIASLNEWTAGHALVANWRDPVNANVWYYGGSWLQPDGFHPQAGTGGPSEYGTVIADAIDMCPG